MYCGATRHGETNDKMLCLFRESNFCSETSDVSQNSEIETFSVINTSKTNPLFDMSPINDLETFQHIQHSITVVIIIIFIYIYIFKFIFILISFFIKHNWTIASIGFYGTI